MRRLFLHLIIYMPLVLLTACDVHEWPDTPENVTFRLKLRYERDMTVWEHLYDGTEVTELGLGDTYDNRREHGKMRYIIRAYPLTEKQRSAREYTREFVFTKDITEGYDHETTLDLAAGDYRIMVWSDLVENDDGDPYHDAGDFAEITLQGDHRGNDDYRDAFRGTGDISLTADVAEYVPGTLEITMQRPLAKFEFITNDLAEFIQKEAFRITAKSGGAESASGNDPATRVNVEDYKVAFHYVGFMPCAYSMLTDKPVDSSTGVMFQSALKELNDRKASLGFDYVFVNGTESAVKVQVGLYDKEGTRLSLTEPIRVPLRRNHHTVLRGKFLMSEASGGVTINPDFDGDHNLIFP